MDNRRAPADCESALQMTVLFFVMVCAVFWRLSPISKLSVKPATERKRYGWPAS